MQGRDQGPEKGVSVYCRTSRPGHPAKANRTIAGEANQKQTEASDRPGPATTGWTANLRTAKRQVRRRSKKTATSSDCSFIRFTDLRSCAEGQTTGRAADFEKYLTAPASGPSPAPHAPADRSRGVPHPRGPPADGRQHGGGR